MRRALVPALLLAGLLTPATAAAADRYASASSTRESGGCTAFTPCTLPYAASVAQAGETVQVGPGTYPLTGDLSLKSGVGLNGIGDQRPLIRTPSYVYASGASAQQRARVAGVEIDGRLLLGGFADGDQLVVRHSANFQSGVAISGGSVLRNSLVVTTVSSADAVEGDTFAPATVLNSTLIAKGAEAYGAAALGETENFDGNCSVYPANLVLKNVIARGGKADLGAEGQGSGDCEATGKLQVSSSNFRTTHVGSTSASIDFGAANQSSAALTDDAAIFADAVLFRQREGAPTHDAGAADPLVAGLDLDGELRVQDAAVDIGVDELPAPPRAVTGGATDVAQNAATLQAVVTPNGAETRVVFDYGPTDAFGSSTIAQVLPAGGAETPVQARMEGLAAGTTFHFRVRAFNPEDAVQPRATVGSGATFATPGIPPRVVVAHPLPPLPDLLTALTAKKSLRLATFRKRGLRAGFTLGRPATAYVVKLTARLGKRAVTLARVRGTAGPGLRAVTLKPSRKTAGRLRRFKRVRAKLVVTAGTAKLSRAVTIKR